MKRAIYLLACLGMMLSLAACGSDDPDVPRDHDVTMTIKALTHVVDAQGNVTFVSGSSNTLVFHPKTLTADMQLSVPLDGSLQTFSITGLPVTAVDYTYRYNFNASTTSNGDVTNLNGTFDISDPIAIMQCDIKGHHVCITVPEVFFSRNSVTMSYSDGSTSSTGNSYWIFSVDDSGNTAGISINDLQIANDILIDATGKRSRSGRFLNDITGNGATITPTATGMTITADEINTIATYGNGDQVTGYFKTDIYPIRDLNAEIDLTTGTYNATFVIRHILARDETTNQPTEWDDISVNATGNIFKQPLFS